MGVAALKKQCGTLFLASKSRAPQARPGSMQGEAAADGEIVRVTKNSQVNRLG